MAGNCCDTSSSWLSSILNKILAALGQLTKIVSDNKSMVIEYPICDNGVQKIAAVTYKNGEQIGPVRYYDKAHQTANPPLNFLLVAFGDCGGSAVTPGLTLPLFTIATAPGTIPAGNFNVKITNVGNAEGSVFGRTLYAGETFERQGYLDEETKVFKRLDAISYNGTGTELHIFVTP
jgi:hypothetical protein